MSVAAAVAERLQTEAAFWEQMPDQTDAQSDAVREKSDEVAQRLAKKRVTALLLAATSKLAECVIGDVSLVRDTDEKVLIDRAIHRLELRDAALLGQVEVFRNEYLPLCPAGTTWSDEDIIAGARSALRLEQQQAALHQQLRTAGAA